MKSSIQKDKNTGSYQLSLLDEIAFEVIIKAGKLSTKRVLNDTRPKTYPRILEDL